VPKVEWEMIRAFRGYDPGSGFLDTGGWAASDGHFTESIRRHSDSGNDKAISHLVSRLLKFHIPK
jgi:hypothetical protein